MLCQLARPTSRHLQLAPSADDMTSFERRLRQFSIAAAMLSIIELKSSEGDFFVSSASRCSQPRLQPALLVRERSDSQTRSHPHCRYMKEAGRARRSKQRSRAGAVVRMQSPRARRRLQEHECAHAHFCARGTHKVTVDSGPQLVCSTVQYIYIR